MGEEREGVVLEVEGEVTLDDYVDFARWEAHRFRAILTGTAIWVASFAVLWAVSTEDWGRVAERAGVGAAVGAVAGLLFFGLPMRWLARMQFSKAYTTNRPLQERCRYRFSEKGVEARSSSSTSQVTWAGLWRAYEARNAFYLYLSSRYAVVVPKRWFRGEDEVRTFREIARGSLPPEACRI